MRLTSINIMSQTFGHYGSSAKTSLHLENPLFPSFSSKFSHFKQSNFSTKGKHHFFCHIYTSLATLYLRFKEQLNKLWTMYKNKLLLKIRYLRIVPGFLLMVAVTIATINLWLNEASFVLLLSGALATLASIITLYTNYFFSHYEGTAAWLSSLWWGLLLSVISFGPSLYRPWQSDDLDRLVDMLLMTSTALKACCDFLDRFCEEISYRSQFFAQFEVSYMLGGIAGGLLFLSPRNDVDLILIMIASSFVLVNLRMKCTLAFFNLFLFVAISVVAVFDNLHQAVNMYALACFYSRLYLPAVIDFYFSPLSALERWRCSFEFSRWKQFFILSSCFFVEGFFGCLALYVIFLHPEYELVFVIPVVSATGAVWLCTHLAYFTTEVTLTRKLNECHDFFHKLPTTSYGTNFSHVMSKKGVRLLCFVGQQTMACSLLSTLLFGAVSWRREDATYPSLLLLVIGFECLSFGRVRELAVKLGGTCAAYALITPTTTVNPNLPVTILPVDSLQKQNDRATSLITSVHKFFALYLIEILGCDYSTTGMGLTSVEEKIKDLFSKRTKEESGNGVRYDTYLFFFSGLTSDDGSLVLGDGATLSPDHFIDLWRESCCDDKYVTSSRLMLILDVKRIEPWLKVVKSLRSDYVAVQGCSVPGKPRHDVEEGLVEPQPQLGAFTCKWVQWNFDVTGGNNTNASMWPDCDESDSKPMYVVSRRWSDFALRVPTVDDTELSGHWRINYTFLCRPCLALSASCARRMRLVRLLSAPGRRYRRLKMRWFPPAVLDTGHGFKLVRYDR